MGKRRMDKKNCIGCRENFYNGNNDLGVKECWNLESAELKTRFRICNSTPMNIKSAYIKSRKPSCYREVGYTYLERIPSYAK